MGSGNGLVSSDNKPLPEPMLTQISVALWRHRPQWANQIIFNQKKFTAKRILMLLFANETYLKYAFGGPVI